jgi:hypothetical protein
MSDVRSKKPTTLNSNGSVNEVNKIKMKNMKPKFPCSLCKGDHFLRDFPGLPNVLEVWSSMSSTLARNVGDTPSTSDIKVCKKKTTVKFPCMLCGANHYSHLFPHMDEASSLLENLQLPISYRNISPNPSLVDGIINMVPSPFNPVDQVVNLVSSSVEPLTQMVYLFPPFDPILPLENENQVVNLMLLSIDPTPPLRSAKVVSLVTSSINPTPALMSAKVVDLVLPSIDPTPSLRSDKVVAPVLPSINPTLSPKSVKVTDLVPSSVSPTLHPKCSKLVVPVTSSINPTLPLKSSKVVDLIPSSIYPTLPLESKPDFSHVFLIDT